MTVIALCSILVPTAATAFKQPGNAAATGSRTAETYATGLLELPCACTNTDSAHPSQSQQNRVNPFV